MPPEHRTEGDGAAPWVGTRQSARRDPLASRLPRSSPHCRNYNHHINVEECPRVMPPRGGIGRERRKQIRGFSHHHCFCVPFSLSAVEF
jgi:hypothetical protein